jgi:large subunit ribosomal protein L3
MARRHRPRRGSLGFSPRVRAAKPAPRVRSWPPGPKAAALQGFAGYKVGMSHAFLVDYRKRSTTAGQEVSVPVTIVEVPPIQVVAARLYRNDPYGRRVAAELWGDGPFHDLDRRLPTPGAPDGDARDVFAKTVADEVRVVLAARPESLTGVPSKTPTLFEVRVGGEKFEDRRAFALDRVGKELTIDQLAKEGEFVDVIGVTKGKGFQGHTKRWGVKLQPRKNSKHRRMIGTLGPHNPSFVTYRIPQAGQTGYHRRTVYNLRVLKVIKDPKTDPVTPAGGFLHYGEVRSPCLVLHGSLPGPAKRLLKFRLPMRSRVAAVEKVDLRYLSTRSKQSG